MVISMTVTSGVGDDDSNVNGDDDVNSDDSDNDSDIDGDTW